MDIQMAGAKLAELSNARMSGHKQAMLPYMSWRSINQPLDI